MKRSTMEFVFFLFLFSFFHTCMFSVWCFYQRTYMTQDNVNGVTNVWIFFLGFMFCITFYLRWLPLSASFIIMFSFCCLILKSCFCFCERLFFPIFYFILVFYSIYSPVKTRSIDFYTYLDSSKWQLNAYWPINQWCYFVITSLKYGIQDCFN